MVVVVASGPVLASQQVRRKIGRHSEVMASEVVTRPFRNLSILDSGAVHAFGYTLQLTPESSWNESLDRRLPAAWHRRLRAPLMRRV